MKMGGVAGKGKNTAARSGSNGYRITQSKSNTKCDRRPTQVSVTGWQLSVAIKAPAGKIGQRQGVTFRWRIGGI